MPINSTTYEELGRFLERQTTKAHSGKKKDNLNNPISVKKKFKLYLKTFPRSKTACLDSFTSKIHQTLKDK